MTRFSEKNGVIIIVLSLVLLSIVATLAYLIYIATPTAGNLTFYRGDNQVMITINETHWENGAYTQSINPGSTRIVPKDPSITFTSGNDKANNIWVAMRVAKESDSNCTISYIHNSIEGSDAEGMNAGRTGDWEQDKEDTNIYYYKTKLPKGGTTSTLFDKVKVITPYCRESTDYAEKTFSIKLEAAAVDYNSTDKGFNNFSLEVKAALRALLTPMAP